MQQHHARMTKVFVDKRLRQVKVKASLFLFEVAIPTALMTKASAKRIGYGTDM